MGAFNHGSKSLHELILGRTLMLDIGEVCSFVQSSRTSMTSSPLSMLRNLLSALIPFGIDKEADRIATVEMGIERPKYPVLKGMIG